MNPSSLVVERLVGVHDPTSSTARLTGWMPGPAGLSLVSLAGGQVALAVDRADPSTLAFLEVPHGRPLEHAVLAALEHLLGPGVVDVLSRVGEEPSLVHEGDEPARRRATVAGAPALGRLAVLRSEVEERSPTGVDLGLALAELARLAHLVDPALGVAPDARQLGAAARAALRGLDGAELLDRLDGEGRAAAAVVLDDLVSTTPDDEQDPNLVHVAGLLRPVSPSEGGLLSFGPELDEGEEVPEVVQPAAQVVAPAPAPAPMSSAVVAVEAAAPPPPPADVEIVSRSDAVEIVAVRWEGSDLHVQIRPDAERRERWLRVFAAPSSGPGVAPVPVALAPFRGSRFGLHEAVALVDPAVAHEPPLLADVTADPREPAGEPSAALLALDLGRRAARAERLDDAAAAGLWQHCAQRWEQAGDQRRARLAAQRADPEQWTRHVGPRAGVAPPPPAFLFDRLSTSDATGPS